jgi:phage-related tail fiber protein
VILSLQTRLGDLATAVATDVKQLRVWITGSSSGALTGLTTTTKTDIVSAINEVNAKPTSGAPPDATETSRGIIELATLAEVATGTDAVRAVTPAGVRQEREAVRADILGAGVPAALDTLDELAAALGDDANFAASVTTALAGKQPLDADLSSIAGLVSAADRFAYATGAGTWTLGTITAAGRSLIDDADVAAMRATLSVYSQADLGNPDTDLVAIYNTAKT